MGKLEKKILTKMKKVPYSQVVKNEYATRLLTNTEFPGFDQDYYVIQCLLMEWRPSSVVEIGTCTGNGSRIMRHCLPDARLSTVDIVECGHLCPHDVRKIVADSMHFDFTTLYPVDCWFIDGEHSYRNVLKESGEVVRSGAPFAIFHDADIPEVAAAIENGFEGTGYDLFHVVGPGRLYSSTGLNVTRVAYAIKSTK
jgi:hypothetical protein